MFDQVDAGCIEAARRSEPGAVDRLVERCWNDAFRVALGILGNRGLAEDAAQESCAALIRSISSLRDTTAFSAWFYRLIVNASRALYRRERRHMDAQDIAWRDLPAPQERNAETIALHTALDRLSSAQREAIVLHYFADLSSREIAHILGSRDGTIRYHLFVARRRLRSLLADVAHHAATMEVNSHAS